MNVRHYLEYEYVAASVRLSKRVVGTLVELPLGLADGDCHSFFERAPLPKRDFNAMGVSLNDDLGVPRRSPAERGSTCEGGLINVVYEFSLFVLIMICFAVKSNCGKVLYQNCPSFKLYAYHS